MPNLYTAHLGASYTWFQAAHGADKEGTKAGIPYDGSNLDYQDLYHANSAPDDKDWLTKNPAFQLEWYRSIKELVDIVSKNGNLLINVVQTPEGDLEPDMLAVLEEIGKWTETNGEGIYGSRSWKIYGEKPSVANEVKRGRFDENYKFSSKDIRFTTKGKTLYAFCLGKPEADIMIKSLAKSPEPADLVIVAVSMLGGREKLRWKQTSDALVIKKPLNLPAWQVIVFKIEFKN